MWKNPERERSINMNILQSLFLGLIQGITEFLPVSSSGHLAILENIFHVETDGGMLFDIMLHIGTLVAVFIVYRKDIWKMIVEALMMIADICKNFVTWIQNKRGTQKKRYINVIHNSYRKFVALILVSTVPTGVIGVIGKDLVAACGETLIIPGICLLITAVLLIIADTIKEGHILPKNMLYRSAIIIGIAQGVATLPGLSRSGTTIAICLLLGLDRKFAVKYSFILSIPAVLGAAVLEVKDVLAEPISAGQIGVYSLGMIVAAFVGYICIKTMLILVRNKKFKYFAYYCVAMGLFSIAGHFFL